jgi:hypothetical protein
MDPDGARPDHSSDQRVRHSLHRTRGTITGRPAREHYVAGNRLVFSPVKSLNRRCVWFQELRQGIRSLLFEQSYECGCRYRYFP